MIALLLQLAVSPVGTWEAETVRQVQPVDAQGHPMGASVPVSDQGRIVFRADQTYVAARRWAWVEDGQLVGTYAYAEGTWRIDNPSSGDELSMLCVKREDATTETCQPFTATDHTLQWGPFTFTGSAE